MDKWCYDSKAVGERIRRRRAEMGFTQAELAEQMGLSPKYCADIERGYCGMSIESLLSFCRVLRLSPAAILLGDALPFAQENRELLEQIVQGAAECTQEQQRCILETIRLFLKQA